MVGRTRKFQIAGAVIVLLALLLRILAARGDLWQDEITSLNLASAAHSPFGVFLLSYDNNHFLNTFYLNIVGPNAPPILLRGLSIVLGTLSVIAAGMVFTHRRMSLLAMALFALSFPMVNYGSEARGYAGLILCTIMAIYAVDREQKFTLAFAIGFGLLFHLNMAAAMAALGLATLVYYWQQTKLPTAAVKKTAALFLPSLCAALLVALIVSQGLKHSNGYHFGYLGPFDAKRFVMGYGGMMNAILGFPETSNPWFGLIAAVSAGITVLAFDKDRNKRKIIYFIFLVVLPAAVFLFHVPNSGIRRYYLSSATVFLLCITELAQQVWSKGILQRAIIVFVLSCFLLVQVYNIAQFLRYGRGHYGDVVTVMTSKGASSYATDGDPWPVRVELDFYTRHKAVTLTNVLEKDACDTPPDWLVIETTFVDPPQPPVRQWGPVGCTYQFGDAQVFEGWGMSGAKLTLYRRIR